MRAGLKRNLGFEHARAARDSTLAYYDRNWRSYVAKTRGIDMAEIVDRFSARLPPGGRVLDVGAGSGRDTKALLARGFEVVALEPSRGLAGHLRREIPGLAVVERRIEDFIRKEAFDGVWACASLLHLDEAGLRLALERIATALRQGGVLYASFKQGHTVRLAADGRLFHDLTLEAAGAAVSRSGLALEESWRSPTKLHGENGTDWSNLLARKPVV